MPVTQHLLETKSDGLPLVFTIRDSQIASDWLSAFYVTSLLVYLTNFLPEKYGTCSLCHLKAREVSWVVRRSADEIIFK